MENDVDTLAKVLTEQNELIDYNGNYKNELETVKLLHTLPESRQKRFNELTNQLLEKLGDTHDTKAGAERSRLLREEGNRLYTSKSKRKPDALPECLLNACRMYTQAILSAENVYEELCLAFANRGMALHDYGFYEQAYDDCECALEFGYPKHLHHKIVMRQAHCASQLDDAKKLAKHLDYLEQVQLNESYRQQLEKLQQQLGLMQHTQTEQPTMRPPELVVANNHKISTEFGSKGRHMLATKRINRGEVIFTERAVCLVPVQQRIICQQCAASVMCAPIPCPQCRQRVIYCSKRCRDLDAQIHSYECVGHRGDLFKSLGISHLAFRLVLNYLPQWLVHLSSCSNAQQMWEKLMSLAQAKHNWPAVPQHIQSLSMISHLAKMDDSELFYHTLCANLLQVYLCRYTKFYDQLLESNTAPRQEWDILIAAVILRSAGQLLVNAHVGDAIVANAPPLVHRHPTLLEPQLWRVPYHLQLGHLHRFSHITRISVLNLPYLALCNHACMPSIHIKCDGDSVSCHAVQPLKPGAEIFNCYTNNYKNSAYREREKQLEEIFKFHCKCVKCARPEPDADFLAFHRIRCERSVCGHIFVPVEQLYWWMQNEKQQSPINCPKCRAPQLFSWHDGLLELMQHCHEPQQRREAFKVNEKLDTWLLGHHCLKLSLAKQLIENCLAARAAGASLDDTDFEHLGRIADRQLAGAAALHGCDSLPYVARLTCLMDLIALGKYKCSAEQRAEIRVALDYLPSDTKLVFVNYFNDFIEQPCK